MMEDDDCYDNGHNNSDYRWHISSFYESLKLEYRYRGWVYQCYEYYLACLEAMEIIRDITKLFRSRVKYEFEPEVPNCRTVCGIIILNVQDLITGSIRKLVRGNDMIGKVRKLFEEFAKITVNKVILEKVGTFEEDENIVTILSNNDVREMLVEEMKKEEAEPRELLEVDAWYINNYPLKENFEYLEKHKLIVTKNNYYKIKTALNDKFPKIEKFVLENRDKINVQFCLPEDFLPKVKLPKKKEITIKFRNKVKNINIDFNKSAGESNKAPFIIIEKPKKEIQIVRKEENKVEIISVETEKKLSERDEEINGMIKSIAKKKEELNIVVIPDKKVINDDDIVKFPTVEVDESHKIKLVTTEENQGFVKVFKDDPVIIMPEKKL
jgi:hypothetical protein